MDHARKPLYFHPSCEKDYKTLPEDVQADAGTTWISSSRGRRRR